MIGSFSFNSLESSVFKLVCKSVKRPLLPAARTNRVEVPGSSGAYDFGGQEYSLRTVTISITYIGTDYNELRTRAREIAAWLSTSDWSKLVINDEPDKYYLAKVTSEIDLESLWESGRAEITFDCQPFAYYYMDRVLTFPVIGSMSYVFINVGTREINFKSPYGSKFKITIVGSWTMLTLSMNGQTLTYANVGSNSTLIIDSIEMEVIQNGINKFDKLDGDIDTFLRIVPGNNTLSITGTGINASAIIEFIPLWV